MSEPQPTRDEQNPAGSAGYSRREVLRLLGAAGAVAGLDRLMPARWLAPQVTAVPSLAASAASAAAPSLSISNLSFAWGLAPSNSTQHTGNASYYCDGNASFVFIGNEIGVNALTMLQLNTSSLGPLYDTQLGSIGGIQIATFTNTSGRITVPFPTGTVPGGTSDMAMVRIESKGVASNTLVEQFLPTCGQTTINDLAAEATVDCLFRDGPNYYCEREVSFSFNPLDDIDSDSLVRLLFNGNLLLNWTSLASLGATIHNGSVSFTTLLPAGQQGPLLLTARNKYGFDTNSLSIQHNTADCGPGLSPFLFGPGASPNNGSVRIAFDYTDHFDHVSNASLITAWLGSPNTSHGQTLLNGMPLTTANGGVLVLNSAVLPWEDECSVFLNTTLALNSIVGNGFFYVSLPETSLTERTAATEEVTVNFFLTPPEGTGKSNTLDVTFEPTAVTLADLRASAPVGGLAGALGAATLAAASLLARFRGGGADNEEDELG